MRTTLIVLLACVGCGPTTYPVDQDATDGPGPARDAGAQMDASEEMPRLDATTPRAPDAATRDASMRDGATAADAARADGSIRDGSTADATTLDAAVPAAPLSAPSETWTWIPVEGMKCGNGSQNGVMVNFTTRSNDVLVVYEGGGACWDWQTCFVQRSASHISDTLSSSTVAIEGLGRVTPYFLRDASDNPFRNASYIYMPYCTGDLHAGDSPTTYTKPDMSESRVVHHVGAINNSILVPRIAATFPSADHVWLIGYSAGGFGITLNWWRYLAAFPDAQVDALNDCGAFVPPADPARWESWKSSMHLVFPPGCTTCGASLTNVLPHYAATVTGAHRYGFLGYRSDVIIQAFFGLNAAQVGAGEDALRAAMPTESNQRSYLINSSDHVMQPNIRTIQTSTHVKAIDWVNQWATGSSSWAHAGP